MDQNNVYQTLKTAFHDNQIATLRSFQQYLPISVSGKQQTIQDVLQKTLVYGTSTNKGQIVRVPLASLVTVSLGEDVKTIVAGKNGEYIPFYYYRTDNPEIL